MNNKEKLRQIAVKVENQDEQDKVAKVFEEAGFKNDCTEYRRCRCYVRTYNYISFNKNEFANIDNIRDRKEISFAEFEKEFINPQPKFKVGDRVKLVSLIFNNEARGNIGTIITVRDDGSYVVCDIDNYAFSQVFSNPEDVELITKPKLNDKFEVGKWYKLRDDYPVVPPGINTITLTFEGRKTDWVDRKQPLFDRKPRKVLNVRFQHKYIEVEFEGIDWGYWSYHPQDFVEVENYNQDPNIDSFSITKPQPLDPDVWEKSSRYIFDGVCALTTTINKPELKKQIIEQLFRGNKIEDITKFNKKALQAAKKQAQDERRDYETRVAKEQYVHLLDKKTSFERKIKEAQEELAEVEKQLKLFGD
jgi:hypothetical protein